MSADSLKHWMDAAGRRKMGKEKTAECLLALQGLEKNSKEYLKLVNKICEGNLLLIVKVAHKLCNRRHWIKWGDHISLDLLQAGFDGLRAAVVRYDPSRASFSTCAYPWIRQRIVRYITSSEFVIHVPENVLREIQYIKTKGKGSGLKSSPKNKDLLEYGKAAIDFVSLNAPIPGNPGGSLMDFIEYDNGRADRAVREARLDTIATLVDRANLEPKLRKFVDYYLESGQIRAVSAAQETSQQTAREYLKRVVCRLRAVA
jgi:RNA polymerase sigma factor (sigma-70 family)